MNWYQTVFLIRGNERLLSGNLHVPLAENGPEDGAQQICSGGGDLDSGNGAQVAAGKSSDGGGGRGLGEE